MQDQQWDEQFEEIVRRTVPFLPADEALAADIDLQDFGLDSFGIIELLVDVENTYGVQFRDEAMNRETFATPASLWSAINGLLEPSA